MLVLLLPPFSGAALREALGAKRQLQDSDDPLLSQGCLFDPGWLYGYLNFGSSVFGLPTLLPFCIPSSSKQQ